MEKKIKALIACLLFIYVGVAQIPNGYYNAAASKTGENLRAALRDIITNGSVKIPYTSSSFDIWDAYSVTDTRPGNNTVIWDMYSDIPSAVPLYTYTLYANQCGTTSAEGGCYSREHQMPNSWWGGFDDAGNPQYTDLHHLPPSDQYVNSRKSAHPIGETNAPDWTSTNGSKVGPCSWPGFTGTVFEPIDAYKGDFARAYLYIATRYMNSMRSWVLNYPGTESQYIIDTSGKFKPWFTDMLIKWTIDDPVSQKEIDRNNAIYYNTPQHNRNPYIDHPEYVCIVWSSASCSNGPLIASVMQNPLNPSSSNTVSVTASVTSTAAISSVYLVYGSDGVNFQDTIVMTLSSGSVYTTSSSIPAAAAGTTVYFKITAVDNLSNAGTSPVNSYTVLKAEPSAYPAGFACGNTSASTISLSWVDAAGGSVPDGYLLKTSNVSLASITDPVDGIPEADGSFIKNIPQGVQLASFTGLASSTAYYFKIYPYTNAGTVIDYKTTVTPPATTCSTAASPGGGCAPDLIISEYVEGTGSNKYIEIANFTGAAVNLGNYRLRLFSNGVTTPTNDVLLSGVLNNQSTIVYKNGSATLFTGTATGNAAINFNGDDAVGLYKVSSASYVDIFGRIGEDPGTAWTSGVITTLDRTLVRNASVTSGVTTNPSAGFPTLSNEWTQYNTDVVSNLGSHSMNCNFCASPTLSATNISFSAVDQVSMTINWTNGNGNKRIVVMKQGSVVTGLPFNGSTYIASNVFGSGNTLNTGEYIVYNNTGSSVSVTNLIGGQTYYISIFEYNCDPGSEIYLTPGTNSVRQTNMILTGSIPESQYCVTGTTGYSTSIDFISTGTFSSNTYTAQLSDADGSFDFPQSIGTLVSNANNETIYCTIPANTPSGTGYLVRVVSSSPAITGSSSNPFEIILSTVAQAPVSVVSSRSGFCSDDAGNITLTATGGSGTVLSWFSSSCGGSFVGSGNPLVIASPTVTTTYYARWGTACSNSGCASVTVVVADLPLASAGAAISSCSGTAPIAMSGATATGATNNWSGGTGLGTWIQNANPALASFVPAVSAGSFTALLTVTGTGSCPSAVVTSTRIISWGTAGTWTGAVSSDWFTSGNWCGGVPLSTTNIQIPPASQVLFSPTIGASNARCQNITLSGTVSIANGYNLDVYGNWINNAGAITGSTSTISFRGITKTIGGTTSTAFPGIIISQGASYTMNNSNTCTSLLFSQGSTSSLTLSGSSLTVNGNINIVNPASGSTNTFNINNGTVAVSGNVTIGNGTSLSSRIAKIVVGSGVLSIAGDLSFNVLNVTAAIMDLSAGAATLNIGGNIILNSAGTLLPGTSSTVNYNGSLAGQTVRFGSGISYYNLSLNNTSSSGVTLGAAVSSINTSGNITVQSGIFNNGAFAVAGNASRQFSVSNGAVFRLSGSTTMPTGFGSVVLGNTSIVEFNGTLTQTIGAFNYGHLTSSGSGNRTLASSGSIGIAGVFTPGTNTYAAAGSTVNFNGSNQSIPVFNAATGYNNLSISQLSGKAVIAGNITVGGTLNLISGSLDLGSNVLTLAGAAAIAGSPFSASKMIIADGGGELRKILAGNSTYLFPTGDNTGANEYSPVTLSYTSGTYATGAYTAVKLSNVKHPANASTINYLNRYWIISNSGISNPLYTVNAVYVAADVTGTDAAVSMGKYSGAYPWIKYSAANSSLLTVSATNVNNTGSTVFSGLSSGPGVSIIGGGVTICSGNAAQLQASVTGSSSYIYQWSPAAGLSNAGIAAPIASPSATTTYTLTVTDGNGFVATANTTITVSSPTASITANGPTTYCQGGSVLLSASAGSGYLWSNGATSQSISVLNSGAYSVTVTNNVGCPAISNTINVTVNSLPTVGFTGLASSYCTTDGQVTLTGTPFGGTFSGTGIAGITFNPAAAGAGGPYTITYTYTDPSTGCSNSLSKQVTVTTCASFATLNLKLFIQGYYQNIGSLTPMDNFGNGGSLYMNNLSSNTNDADNIEVGLMSTSDGSLVESQAGILHTDGNMSVNFAAARIGNSYYLRIRHRNSIETWSAVPVAISATTSYNFTSSAGMAYGNNQVEVEPGIFAIYSGDIIDADTQTAGVQDGVIESSDYSLMENDVYNVTGGYQPADITGDGVVESADYSIMENNVYLVIAIMKPF